MKKKIPILAVESGIIALLTIVAVSYFNAKHVASRLVATGLKLGVLQYHGTIFSPPAGWRVQYDMIGTLAACGNVRPVTVDVSFVGHVLSEDPTNIAKRLELISRQRRLTGGNVGYTPSAEAKTAIPELTNTTAEETRE